MTVQKKKLKKNIFSIQEAAMKIFPALDRERAESFLTIVLTLLALSIFGLFAISPTITTIIQLRKQLSDNILVDQKLNEKIANLSLLQTKYDSLQVDLPLVLAAVPELHKMPSLLGQIQAIAGKENVTITRIQTDPLKISITPINSGTPITFSLDAEGSENNIKSFIKTLATFERIVVLDTITLSTIDNKQASTTQVDIKGRAYFKSF